MNGHADQGGDTRRDWDAYWRNAGLAPALRDGGPQDEALEQFWSELLDGTLARTGGARTLLDVASGNGAVVRFALKAGGKTGMDSPLGVAALDGSPAALVELHRRHPDVRCVVADALRPPFPGKSFDIVTSQFGLEYAGTDALPEAARLVADGGVFGAVLHLKDGGIFRECSANLEAIDRFRGSGLLPRFDAVYRAAWAMKQSAGTVDALREADRALAVAVKACEDTLRRFGREVASGTLFRIYQDVGHMHARLGAYDPGEMAAWLDNMAKELDSYSGRMASMLAAALTADQVAEATRQLVGAGFRIRRGGVLKFGRPAAPSAWVIVADRTGAP